MWTGIDPGKKGSVVTIHPNGWVDKKVMPLIDKDIDLAALCQYMSELDGHYVTLEDIHSIRGTSKGSMFTMGRGLGNIEAALYCNGINFDYVRPYDWQKEVWIEEDMVWNVTIGKNGKEYRKRLPKPTSLNCVRRLYPHLDLRYGDYETPFPGKIRQSFHDGIVDALLMAHYTKLRYENQ